MEIVEASIIQAPDAEDVPIVICFVAAKQFTDADVKIIDMVKNATASFLNELCNGNHPFMCFNDCDNSA
jgi:hypothetical protein